RRKHELTIAQTIDDAAGSSVVFVSRINWVVSRMVCVAEGEGPACHGPAGLTNMGLAPTLRT
ncbi:MAG: hypothetical protein ACKEQI_00210, partial [Candidatus Hodgkinia cicadicola]